jgi:hypothetical protein
LAKKTCNISIKECPGAVSSNDTYGLRERRLERYSRYPSTDRLSYPYHLRAQSIWLPKIKVRNNNMRR